MINAEEMALLEPEIQSLPVTQTISNMTLKERWISYCGHVNLWNLLPVLLTGSLFHALDAISYGMIVFPASIVPFNTLTGVGVSMYLLSTLVGQLVYSLFSSFRHGVTSSMMVENIPFYRILCSIVVANSPAESQIATVLFLYILGSLLTSLGFFLLGYFKLGKCIDYVPKQVLVGCIGGIALFLFQVSFELVFKLPLSATSIGSENLNRIDLWMMWILCLILPLGLRLFKRFVPKFEFADPLFFTIIPFIFHLTVFIAGISLEDLRNSGWLFKKQETSFANFEMYKLVDLSLIDWTVLPKVALTMVGMVLLSLIHIPINCRAYSFSTGQNMNMNYEFKLHSIGNLISSFLGFSPNYFVYSNSVLLYKLGSRSRITGVLLAAAVGAIIIGGNYAIGFIPTLLVSLLVNHLTFDLMTEAFIHSFKSSTKLEYLNLLVTSFSMLFIGFIEGVIIGLIMAMVLSIVEQQNNFPLKIIDWQDYGICHFRNDTESSFLGKITRQCVQVVEIQGPLFFGNAANLIDKVSANATWIVLDCSMVTFVDQSAAHSITKCIEESKQRWCVVNSNLEERMKLSGLDESEFLIFFSTAEECQHYLEEWFLRWMESSETSVALENFLFPIRRREEDLIEKGTRFSVSCNYTIQVQMGSFLVYSSLNDAPVARIYPDGDCQFNGSMFYFVAKECSVAYFK